MLEETLPLLVPARILASEVPALDIPQHSMRSLSSNFDSKRGVGGLPSSRLLKGRGSVVPGDDSTLDSDSVDAGDTGEGSEK